MSKFSGKLSLWLHYGEAVTAVQYIAKQISGFTDFCLQPTTEM